MIFRDMLPADAAALRIQPRQLREAGIDRAGLTIADGEDLVRGGDAWAAVGRGGVMAIGGFRHTFPGRQGVAWALFADGIGIRSWGAITAFARTRVMESPLRRIEAIVVASADGRERGWAQAIGLRLAHVLECFGADSETHFLFERIRREGC